jgi:molybdenum cofactor biosynthesis enzyme MoaA
LTVFNIEYMPIGCTYIDRHVDQLTGVGKCHQRPERALDLDSLSRGRLDEPVKRWLDATQKEIGLIAAVNQHSCNRLRLIQVGLCLHSHLPEDEAIYFKIPLRTGCDRAARSKLIQKAIGAQPVSCAPQWLFEQRVQCGKSRIGG